MIAGASHAPERARGQRWNATAAATPPNTPPRCARTICLHDADPVLEDAWALRLLEPELRAAVEKGDYHALLARAGLRPTQGHIVHARALRGRRARGGGGERRAPARRARRRARLLVPAPRPRVRVIEVDHPASQRTKRERLAALGAPTRRRRVPRGRLRARGRSPRRSRAARSTARARVRDLDRGDDVPAGGDRARDARADPRERRAGQRAGVRLPDPGSGQLDPEVLAIARIKNAGLATHRPSRASPPTTRTTSRARSPSAASRSSRTSARRSSTRATARAAATACAATPRTASRTRARCEGRGLRALYKSPG